MSDRRTRVWTRAELAALIGVRESQGLEFKEFAALTKDHDICKDVSAFANAAGGSIIYGVREGRDPTNKKIGTADALVGGDPASFNRDRTFQILNDGIEPRLTGVDIQTIELGDGSIAVVIEVPQSFTLAPHQARHECRYYRRYGTEAKPMLDHEVRDVMGRHANPDLSVVFTMPFDTDTGLYQLQAEVRNRSPEMALYYAISLYLDPALMAGPLNSDWAVRPSFWDTWPGLGSGAVLHHFKYFATPRDMPVFREMPVVVFTRGVPIPLNRSFRLGYGIVCPGFNVLKLGSLIRLTGQPFLEGL